MNTPKQNEAHKLISYVKSGFRIIGCAFGVVASQPNILLWGAFLCLILAECFGIIEEMVVE